MPVPPVAVIVTGVIVTPCTAVIVTQLAAIGGGATVTEQLNVPLLPPESVTVTV